MFTKIVATLALLLAPSSVGPLGVADQEFPLKSLDSVAPSVLRVEARHCRDDHQLATSDRVATGFVWRDKTTVVTAFHVVSGCPSISVYYQGRRISRPATVMKLLRRADLVLLSVGNSPETTPLQDDQQAPSLDQELATLGFQLQIPDMSSTRLHLRYGGRKLRDIVPSTVAQALSTAGSPSLDLEITNIEGHLVPGLSGAPIFNQADKVVAIADGGLENGTVGISWGIPARALYDLAGSQESIPDSGGGGQNGVLFAAETDATFKGQQTCSGLPLTKLRTTSFSQIASSTDDALGLQQLINYFAVDPTAFSFDVYQHLPSGATIAIPSGAQLATTGNRACVAALANGEVVMMLQLAMVSSEAELQSVSTQLEINAAGGSSQGWYGDNSFTYPLPVTRFDGLILRRRGYVHLDGTQVGLNQVPQDRYLFETIATRGHVMLFASVMNNSATVANNLKAIACRGNPSQSGCPDIINKSTDWVRSVIAVHLSTFPIG
jgi:Trypsin-like peptidase domain